MIIASGGYEALEILLDSAAPKVAIRDRVMTGMGGIAVLQQLRKDHGEHYVHVLLLTSKREKKGIVM